MTLVIRVPRRPRRTRREPVRPLREAGREVGGDTVIENAVELVEYCARGVVRLVTLPVRVLVRLLEAW